MREIGQIDRGVSDLMWPEPWVEGGRGLLGPGGSSMAIAI